MNNNEEFDVDGFMDPLVDTQKTPTTDIPTTDIPSLASNPAAFFAAKRTEIEARYNPIADSLSDLAMFNGQQVNLYSFRQFLITEKATLLARLSDISTDIETEYSLFLVGMASQRLEKLTPEHYKPLLVQKFKNKEEREAARQILFGKGMDMQVAIKNHCSFIDDTSRHLYNMAYSFEGRVEYQKMLAGQIIN